VFDKGCDNEDTAVVSQLGDVWLLNQHRLMCGDSTNVQHVKQLMTEKADMAFIDPPYKVNYQGCRTIREKIKNDALAPTQLSEFLNKIIRVRHLVLKRGASLYIYYGGRKQLFLQKILEHNQFEIRNQIV
jgi:DNA modification methylase